MVTPKVSGAKFPIFQIFAQKLENFVPQLYEKIHVPWVLLTFRPKFSLILGVLGLFWIFGEIFGKFAVRH